MRENTVNLNAMSTRRGFHFLNTNGINVSCNEVHPTFNNGNAWGSYPAPANCYAYRFMSATGNQIHCNTSDETTEGFAFVGDCAGTDFQSNTIGTHKNGLHMYNSAIFTEQVHEGNKWTGTYEDFGAWHQGSNFAIFQEPFFISEADAAFWPPSYAPTLSPDPQNPTHDVNDPWMRLDNFGTEQDCPNTCIPGLLAIAGTTEREQSIVAGTLSIPIFEVPLTYDAKQYLYDYLQKHPELKEEEVTLADFYDTHLDGTIGQLHEVKVISMSYLVPDETEKGQIQAWDAQTDSINWVLANLWVNVDSGDIEAAQAARELSTLLYAELDNIYAQRKDFALLLETQFKNTADAIRAMNSSIYADVVFKTNERTANDIYLATVAVDVDTLETTQLSTLQAIAAQCPLAGGRGVYLAREILAQTHHTYYDDDAICEAVGIIMMQGEAQQTAQGDRLDAQKETGIGVSLYPNPARDEVTIVLENNRGSITQITFSDALGREALKRVISTAVSNANVPLATLVSGVYTVRVWSGDQIVSIQLLTIVK